MDKLFVIGDPISQSKSPAIHNYWIKKYSLDAIYDKLQVKEEQIPNLLEKIRGSKGVMLDDIMAGIYTAIVVLFINSYIL